MEQASMEYFISQACLEIEKMETVMKHIIVPCFALLLTGFNIPVHAQMNSDYEIYVEQVLQEKNASTWIYEGTLELPEHPLIEAFFDLHQALAANKNGLGNTAYGLQDGSSNIADITQTGFNHIALSWQQGNNNFHTVNQYGSETTASGIQIGDGNEIRQALSGTTAGMVIQLGYGNFAKQELSGFNNGIFSIQQEGNNNSLYQLETGISIPYQIRQRGHDMELIIINSTIQ